MVKRAKNDEDIAINNFIRKIKIIPMVKKEGKNIINDYSLLIPQKNVNDKEKDFWQTFLNQ